MDLKRFYLVILLFFGIIFLVYQTQSVSAQEYYEFANIPDDVNATYGEVIRAFESDLNVISSIASPGLDPRQVIDEEINDERLDEMGNQNFNGNLEEGIVGLKKLASGFTASGSNVDGVNSDQFTETSKMIQEKFDFSNINLNEDLGATLSILNSIAIILMAIIFKIKLSNKVIVSKPSK
ncbi:MAG TPA: hypothetical protein VLA01_01180 [Nitrosopumilaceae archaeon]|nr:hypothetical protein [Nitrosopumilaceae archaeon]